MLTYETIRKIEEEEKESEIRLAKLPARFFEEVREYLDKKEKISKEKGEEWELQSAKRRLQYILEKREKKIINLALYSVRSGLLPENITPEEKQFFDAIVNALKDFEARRKQAIEGMQAKKSVVAILQVIPKFVGIDMVQYGPYKRGDIATLPRENASLLIQKNMAEPIEVE